jgi:hypothetical protein
MPGRRARTFAALLVAAQVVALAACGPTEPSVSATPSASASAAPTPSASSPASPSVATLSPSVEIPPSLPPGVTVDPGLLEVLPVAVDGVALAADPATAAEIAADPLLADSALSIAVAVAIAVAPGASESDDVAVASVIRLRPDVFDEAFYQEWRDTYNQAACEVADGVDTETPTRIGGRASYLGTCVGGARTYHTYLEDQGFIVSVTATGARRFGELILAGLAG